MNAISVSKEERASGRLTPEHLSTAAGWLENDGFLVIEDAIDLDHVLLLREKMIADVDLFLNRKDRPFNWNSGNLQQSPPPFAPYVFSDVLANDFAIQVTHALLGDGMYNGFYSGNTALKSSSRQPVHADIGQLWPNLKVATPPYGIVVNVPVVDVSAENGSTEIWPGTHLDTSVTMQSGEIKVAPDVLEARRKVSPPLQPNIKSGGILIRDIRLWHAGMPNHIEVPRPMIAMIHYVGWWPSDKFPLTADAEPLLAHPTLRQHADFVKGPIDYISQGSSHEYDQK